MRINTLPGLVVLIGLSLSLTACKDTTTVQENEHLKGQVAELQKENSDLTNSLQTVTASRDTLAKENESLTSDLKPKRRRGRKKK
jgi:FtsZ-binding cell division protein ZapB